MYSQTKYRSSRFSRKEVTKFLKENKAEHVCISKEHKFAVGGTISKKRQFYTEGNVEEIVVGICRLSPDIYIDKLVI